MNLISHFQQGLYQLEQFHKLYEVVCTYTSASNFKNLYDLDRYFTDDITFTKTMIREGEGF